MNHRASNDRFGDGRSRSLDRQLLRLILIVVVVAVVNEKIHRLLFVAVVGLGNCHWRGGGRWWCSLAATAAAVRHQTDWFVLWEDLLILLLFLLEHGLGTRGSHVRCVVLLRGRR